MKKIEIGNIVVLISRWEKIDGRKGYSVYISGKEYTYEYYGIYTNDLPVEFNIGNISFMIITKHFHK